MPNIDRSTGRLFFSLTQKFPMDVMGKGLTPEPKGLVPQGESELRTHVERLPERRTRKGIGTGSEWVTKWPQISRTGQGIRESKVRDL